jgi:hypothetical protein
MEVIIHHLGNVRFEAIARGLSIEDLEVRVTAEKAAQPARLGSFRIEVAVRDLDPPHEAGILRAVKGVPDSKHAGECAGHRDCDREPGSHPATPLRRPRGGRTSGQPYWKMLARKCSTKRSKAAALPAIRLRASWASVSLRKQCPAIRL